MLKMRLTNGDLVFGLSALNVERLKTGKPIAFDLAALGLPPCRVMIFYGNTETDMMAELKEAGMFAPELAAAPGGKLNG